MIRGCLKYLIFTCEEKFQKIYAVTLILEKRKWVVIKITYAWYKIWMLIIDAIHHLQVLIEEILVSK